MIRKRFNKPFYKQFLRIRVNIQNRVKLFNFKKQKWSQFQFHDARRLKFFKRYKFKDQFRVFVKKYASRANSLKKNFRNNLQERKIFSLFYGGLKKNYFKTHVTNSIKSAKLKQRSSNDMRHNVIQFFESRLDTVLYRTGFCPSIKSARKLILHGHVRVNKIPVTTSSYILKANDLIDIKETLKSRKIVKNNLRHFNFWPIPAKHLLVNYKTLQIIFLYSDSFNLIPAFSHYLNLSSVVSNIRKW